MKKLAFIHDVLKILYQKKFYIVRFSILSVFTLLFSVLEPLFAQRFINNVINTINSKATFTLGLFWIGIFTLKMVIEYLRKMIYTKYRNDSIKIIQKGIFCKYLNIQARKAEDLGIGYIVTRINNDVDSLDGLMCGKLVNVIIAFVQATWVLSLMLKMDLILTLCSVVIAIGYVSVQFLYPLKKLYKDYSEARSNYNKDLNDTLGGLRVIKTHNSQMFEQERYEKNVSMLLKYKTKREVADNFRHTASSYLYTLGTPLLYFIGGLLVLIGHGSVGEIVAFIMFYNLFAGSCMTIGTFFPEFNISVGAAERIQEVINLTDERVCEQKTELNDKSERKVIYNNTNIPAINFDNVSFSYSNNSDYALKDLSFSVKQNERIAIVGPSGSGKSTIANLLLRIEEVSSGNIYLFGRPISEYDISTVRSFFGYIQQDSYLFNRSIYENIDQGKKLSIEETKSVLKEAFAYSFVMEWPNNINTIINEKGKSMSGGEKQRLSIARELAKHAPIILMDEATSSLDPLADDMVLKAIEVISQNRTVVTITHKLINIRNVDTIYVLDNGRIVETGSHESLMRSKGLYYNMYTCQEESTLHII